MLFVLIFTGLAVAYDLRWPPSYAASAHVWAAGRLGMQLREGSTAPEDPTTATGTQAELLQSSFMLGRAMTKLRNTLHIEFTTNWLGALDVPKIKAAQVPKSAVIEVTAKGSSPQITVAFLNAVLDEFLAYKRELRQASSGETYASVSEQTRKQEGDLKAEQENLNGYMQSNNVGVLAEQAKAAGVYHTQLLSQRDELRLQYEVLDAVAGGDLPVMDVLTNPASGPADPRSILGVVVPSALPAPEFLLAKTELERARIQRGRLSKYLRPKHPKIVKIDERIAQSEAMVDFISHQGRNQVASLKQTIKLKIERVEKQIVEWEAKISDASLRIAEFERRRLTVARLQDVHDHMLQLLMTVDVARSLDSENVTVLDRAVQAEGANKEVLVTAFLVCMGLGAGLGFVFLLEQLDDRMFSSEDLASRFEEWVVGQVPDTKPPRKRGPLLLAQDDGRHTFAESYRAIRSALLFSVRREDRPKVILVTSAAPKEGKSVVAMNLARCLAFGGARVLLVDADLRRGVLHETLDLAEGPGLGDLLARDGDLSFYLVKSGVENLMFLPRGKATDNAGELFLSAACSHFLERARKDFDFVVIDTSPVFAADDTTTLAPKADGVLFVVRHSHSTSDSVRHALEMLYERQAKVLGLVYNRADASARSYRYYKYPSAGRQAGKA